MQKYGAAAAANDRIPRGLKVWVISQPKVPVVKAWTVLGLHRGSQIQSWMLSRYLIGKLPIVLTTATQTSALTDGMPGLGTVQTVLFRLFARLEMWRGNSHYVKALWLRYCWRGGLSLTERAHGFSSVWHLTDWGDITRIIVNGKSKTRVYSTWNVHMAVWEMPIVNRTKTRMEIYYYLRDRRERDYVMMLDNLGCERSDGHGLHPGPLTRCLLYTAYDWLSFIFWSILGRSAVRFEMQYPSGDDNIYFVGWHTTRSLWLCAKSERRSTYGCQSSRKIKSFATLCWFLRILCLLMVRTCK